MIEAGQIKGAIVDPLPGLQTQEGPNCGFYALSIVMDYWKAKGASAVSFAARKRDVELQGRVANEGRSLRNLGKEVGALNLDGAPKLSTGGVFTAEQLAMVAKATRSFQASVISKSVPEEFIAAICESIDDGKPPIVAFDVVKGDPKSDQGGQHSHWVVVFGHFDHRGQRQFIGTHGHGSYYNWAAADLQQSNFALNGTRRHIPEEAKVKILGMPGLNAPKYARPHWNSVADLEKVQAAAKGKPEIKIETIDKAGRRPAVAVLQNLAHHIVCVYP